MIWSEILSFYAYTSRMWQNNKHTNRQIRTTTGLFQFFNKKKKTREATTTTKKNDDVSTTLLLAVATRTSKRADGVGETTKRKAWPTSSGNREEKVCMYMEAIEWGKKRRRRKRAMLVCRKNIDGRSSFFSNRHKLEEKKKATKKRRKEEKRKKMRRRKGGKNERECTSDLSPDQSVSNDDAMLMNSSIVDNNFLCVSLFQVYCRQRPTSSLLSLPAICFSYNHNSSNAN